MIQEITGTARAKFFSTIGIETREVKISADGATLVWDSIAGHYTRCHALSTASQKRIARKIRQEVA
jgi:hypothetical protein